MTACFGQGGHRWETTVHYRILRTGRLNRYSVRFLLDPVDRLLQHVDKVVGRLLELLDAVKGVRNPKAHLEGPSTAALEQAADDLTAALFEAMDLLEPLATLRLIVAEEAENDPVLDRCTRFRGRVLAGDHPEGWPFSSEASIAETVRTGVPYLRLEDGRLLSPAPFLALRSSRPPYELGVLLRLEGDVGTYRVLGRPDTWTDEFAGQRLKARWTWKK